MKKGIVLAAVFIFVVGTIAWTSYAPNTHSFDNFPISIEYSWHVGEFSGLNKYYLANFGSEPRGLVHTTTINTPIPTIEIGVSQNSLSGYIPICLDLDITNRSNKTIKNIRAYLDVGQYGLPDYGSSDRIVGYTGFEGVNLLWGYNDFLDWISPVHAHKGAVSLGSGETRTVRLLVYQEWFSTSYDLSEEEIRAELEDYIEHSLTKFDVNLYISWIQYSGLFGGQWGHAFSLAQRGGTYQFLIDTGTGMLVINELPTGVVKIDIEPYKR